jgi:hypothetical protein
LETFFEGSLFSGKGRGTAESRHVVFVFVVGNGCEVIVVCVPLVLWQFGLGPEVWDALVLTTGRLGMASGWTCFVGWLFAGGVCL